LGLAVVALTATALSLWRSSRHAVQEAKRAAKAQARAEAEARHVTERLSLANAAAGFGTWRFDLQDQRVYLSAGLNRLRGFDEKETVLSLKDASSWIHPEDRKRVAEERLRALAQGSSYEVEHRIVRRDGEVRWLRQRGRVLKDTQGRPEVLTGATVDITELKHAEESMRLLSEASRLLAESLDYEETLSALTRMAVPSFADAAELYLVVPETGETRIVAQHAADPELLAFSRPLHSKRISRNSLRVQRVLRTGRSELLPRMTEEGLQTDIEDEETRLIIRQFGVSSVVLVPIAIEGKPVGALMFVSTGSRTYGAADVLVAEELARRASNAMYNAQLFQSAQEERRRAQDEGDLRERLLAIVGHDLRNPLSAIKAGAQVLCQTGLDARQEKFARRIVGSAERMARMIHQLLDFARVRQGMSLPVELEPTDLHEVCRAVVEELRLGSPGRQIDLVLEGHGHGLFDEGRLSEAVSNLVGNALQHGADGPVSVRVWDASPDMVALEVHNQGPPIPPHVQDTIFEAFVRGAGSQRDSKSLGLGLFIVREIVRAHGGSIFLRSPDGEGTTFTVVLARKPAEGFCVEELPAPMA
jgi:PAS domain S-box-containing protein